MSQRLVTQVYKRSNSHQRFIIMGQCREHSSTFNCICQSFLLSVLLKMTIHSRGTESDNGRGYLAYSLFSLPHLTVSSVRTCKFSFIYKRIGREKVVHKRNCRNPQRIRRTAFHSRTRMLLLLIISAQVILCMRRWN